MVVRSLGFLVLGLMTCSAGVITEGFTFSVASAGGDHSRGTHYHSSTGGVYGDPSGKAEVGSYASEEVRGLSEYNLAGLGMLDSVFVTFNTYSAGGLSAGVNDEPWTGTINVYAYQGNTRESVTAYEALPIAFAGALSTSGLVEGGIVSMHITSIFNSAIGGGLASLGIRLERAGNVPSYSGAWTFDTFRLTSDDQSTAFTPEPHTYLLTAAGLAGLALARRRGK